MTTNTTIDTVSADAVVSETSKKKSSQKKASQKSEAGKKESFNIFHKEFIQVLHKALESRCVVTDEGYTTCCADEIATDPEVIEAANNCKLFNKDLLDVIKSIATTRLEKNGSLTVAEMMGDKIWKKFGVQIDQMKLIAGVAVNHTSGVESVQRVGIRKVVGEKKPATQPSHTVLKVMIMVAGRLGLIKGFSISRKIGFHPVV